MYVEARMRTSSLLEILGLYGDRQYMPAPQAVSTSGLTLMC